MWMLDVFCCALGCVTLLWLLKTREAGEISEEALQAAALVQETKGKLEDSEKESALRLANAERLAVDVDALNKQLALMKTQPHEVIWASLKRLSDQRRTSLPRRT
jgi:hypothetical protein